ncbi:hypothetical protein [uncultured Muribaculum sp.]|uniref:phage head spike fiber domain-containing protein n=1 Tax=uncultured Muribaculum sp. TaxID=1918613 RepID=UPI00266FF337|nr:hypothetical protein [uncultured Muribaculum sp.]
MINVKIIKKPKGNISTRDNGIATNGNGYRTGAVTKEAVHAARADLASYAENAGMADNATHADEAEHAKSAFDIDADSPVREEFLSKVKDDRTSHKLSSDKGFEAGEYLAGASGGFFGMDAAGDSFAEVARLYVRVKAFFEELTVVKARVLAGKQYNTPGGGIKCTRVEETAEAWRCWFLSEQDGEKTGTSFITKDQAISEMFNAVAGTSNKVSNHRYWRLVTAVENDALTDDNGNHYGYIDLSKTDCEPGSDTPKAGDEICQLGYRGTDNPQRQTAMVFSTVDADAPSVKLYGGIDSFSLEGRAVVLFGRDPQSGKIFFRLGASGARQYLEYTQDGGLKVAGSISAESTWDDGSGSDRTLKDVVEDKVVDTDVLFRLHTSRTDAPVLPIPGPGGTIANPNGWQTEAPEGRPGMYMWQTTYVRRGDGTAEFRGTSCVQGKDAAGYSPNMLVGAESVTTHMGGAWGPTGTLHFDEGVRLAAGDTLALSVDGIENVAGDASEYSLGIYDTREDRFIHATFTLTATDRQKVFVIDHAPADMKDCAFYLYSGRNGHQTGNRVRYSRIMLVRGDMPQAWVPAASEMKGTQGTAAKVVTVNADASVFAYADDFATLTGPGVITLTAALQGTSGYQWSYRRPGQQSFTELTGQTSATYQVAHDGAIWGSGGDRTLTIRCTSGGVYDEVTVTKVSSGSNGAQGIPGAGYTENLLTGTREFDVNSTAYPLQHDTYNGLSVRMNTGTQYGGPWMEFGNAAVGEEYTVSVFAKGNCERVALEPTLWWAEGAAAYTAVSKSDMSVTGEWKRYYFCLRVTKAGIIGVKAENPTTSGSLYLCGYKFERGLNESPVWSPNSSEMTGRDAYTVVLTNESHIFEGDTEKAVAGTAECGITAYRGATRVPATVGIIGGIPTGMTCTVRDNGGEAARIEVSVTPALTQRQGVLDMPVTVDGQAFIKKFSWSLSLAGAGHSPNLLLKTERADTFTASADQAWGPMITRYLDEGVRLSVGDTMSLSVGSIENVAGDASEYEMFLYDKAARKIMHPSVRLTASDRQASFRLAHVPADMKDCAFYMYAGLNGQQTGNHVVYGRIMLVKGDMPAAWAPAVSEQAAPVFSEQYYLSESRLELRGGTGGDNGWHDTKPQPQTGRHYWTRTKITYGDGTIEYTEPVCAAPEPGYTDNLLPGTRDWRGWDTGTSAKDGEYRGLEVLHCDNSSSQSLLNMASYDGVGLENGRAYTMSFYARGTGRLSSYLHPDVSARVYFQDGTPVSGNARPDTWTERTLTGEWRRYCAVFHTAASGTLSGKVFLIRAEAGCDAWVAGAKLEEGENPSPQWSPAAGDPGISGDNLALGTGSAWYLDGGSVDGVTATRLYGIGPVAAGTTVTVSFDYEIRGMTFGTGGYMAVAGSIPYFNNAEWSERITDNGSGHSSKTVVLTKVPANDAQRYARLKTSGVTGSATAESYVRITNFKIEKGRYETPWKPNATDYNYLSEALKQGGSVDAGLVLTRLLQLGCTDASGAFRTTAGMNGLVRDPSAPGDLAIWAGGDPGEHMDASRVAMGWFHDGTGFAAHNTIRFKDRAVELGEGMELTEREMCLKDEDGNRRYVISRDSVGTPEDYLTDAKTGVYKALSFSTADIVLYIDGAESEFGFDTGEKSIGEYGGVRKGSTARVDVDSLRRFVYSHMDGNDPVPSDEAWAENKMFSTSVRLYFRESPGGAVSYRDIPYRPRPYVSGTATEYEAKGTAEYVIQGAGSGTVTLKVTACLVHSVPGGSPSQLALAGGVSVTAQGVIGRRYDSQVRNGPDGWVAVWPTTASLVREGHILHRVGDYGFRIDLENGVLINRGDGRGWVPL